MLIIFSFTLLTLLSCVRCAKVVTQKPSVLTEEKGKSVTMDCNVGRAENYYVSWYKQTPNSAPQFVLRFHHTLSSPDYYGDGFTSSRFTSRAQEDADHFLLHSPHSSVMCQMCKSGHSETLNSVTMDCNIEKDYTNVYWYKQTPNSAPQFVLSYYNGHSSPSYGDGFTSSRFTSTTQSNIDYRLTISSVDVGDSAVYFCGTRDSSDVFVSQ